MIVHLTNIVWKDSDKDLPESTTTELDPSQYATAHEDAESQIAVKYESEILSSELGLIEDANVETNY